MTLAALILPVRFLPALPARGATDQYETCVRLSIISTRAPREGSDCSAICKMPWTRISTRAPREGSDVIHSVAACAKPYFYPRSPRGERLCLGLVLAYHSYFYPRSPRGERRIVYAAQRRSEISTRAPREGSDRARGGSALRRDISTRAPREGSDHLPTAASYDCPRFLPALPARGATTNARMCVIMYTHFYPRSPRGERLRSAKNRCRLL